MAIIEIKGPAVLVFTLNSDGSKEIVECGADQCTAYSDYFRKCTDYPSAAAAYAAHPEIEIMVLGEFALAAKDELT
jgi:hypothetical protein